MADKELTVECPCCKARMIVDPDSGGVIRFTAHKEAAQSLEDFMKNEGRRQKELSTRFAEARQREESKIDLLNKKFEWAKKNKDKLPEAPKPDIHWD